MSLVRYGLSERLYYAHAYETVNQRCYNGLGYINSQSETFDSVHTFPHWPRRPDDFAVAIVAAAIVAFVWNLAQGCHSALSPEHPHELLPTVGFITVIITFVKIHAVVAVAVAVGGGHGTVVSETTVHVGGRVTQGGTHKELKASESESELLESEQTIRPNRVGFAGTTRPGAHACMNSLKEARMRGSG